MNGALYPAGNLIARGLPWGIGETEPRQTPGREHRAALDAFLKAWRLSPVLRNALVVSRRLGYDAVVDLVADLPDGRRAAFDFEAASTGVGIGNALHLAAIRYADTVVMSGDVQRAELPMSEVGIDATYGVALRADGTFEVVPVVTDDVIFECFVAVSMLGRRAEALLSCVGKPEQW